MRLHYIQHVEHEGPGGIAEWALARGHELTGSQIYAGEALPPPERLDGLIVMGGPMNVDEEAEHAWLAPEKRYLNSAIDAGLPVLGICLGAQLLAEVLGGEVSRNPQPEVGWFEVERSEAAAETLLGEVLPPWFQTFHWHGDTFSTPPGARSIGRSAGCANQGFVYRNRVVGLQFHPEMTAAVAQAIIANSDDYRRPGPYIQQPAKMLADPDRFAANQRLMVAILERLFGR